jgi:hypothetical protein
LAIQRRAVRTDIPVSRAMSRARRYSGASVISETPDRGACCRMASAPGRQIRGQPDAPANARAQSARRAPQIGCSQQMVNRVVALRPEYRGSPEGGRNGQIVVSFARKRPLGPCALGCARHPRKI